MAERLNVSNQSKREQFDWFSECQRLMSHTVEKYTYGEWIKIENSQKKDFFMIRRVINEFLLLKEFFNSV